MSDELVVEAPKATVFVSRKIAVRQYESLECAIHFPVELPLDMEPEAVDRAIKAGFFTAKAAVFEQAGVQFEDKDGVLVEMVTKKFEGSAEVVKTAPRDNQGGSTAPEPVSSGPPCPKCKGQMYDNRPKKASGQYKATASDFRCKDKSCGGVIWPLR